MPTADLAARLNDIHDRLVAGSRSASLDLFLVALNPIKAYVLKTQLGVRDDEAHDLATDVILAYLQAPQQFDPSRASLWTYLCMAASSDAIDLLRTQGRQRDLLQNASQDVELWGSRANDEDEIESSIDARRIIQAHGHRLATNEPERRILALLLNGEKSTDAFAEALGLDPAQPTTTGMVKQAKDRLLLRLRRLRDEL
jgi:RNA polymerase sigma-70 factor (ECF subfamily)